MTIYPAIDLRNGRCVRLRQGDLNRETVFSDDPAAMARHWIDGGAEWLHLVDLDSAFTGASGGPNAAAIRSILASASVPAQLGGGMRSLDAIRAALEAGIQRAIIGTAAIESPELVREAAQAFPGRIAVGIDARDGFVATRGWKVVTDVLARDFARRMEDFGSERIIYTDIGSDGLLEGPNLAATVELAEGLSIPVIASGGVSSLDDLRRLAAASEAGIEGVIVGRALYDRRFTLPEAIAAARN